MLGYREGAVWSVWEVLPVAGHRGPGGEAPDGRPEQSGGQCPIGCEEAVALSSAEGGLKGQRVLPDVPSLSS